MSSSPHPIPCGLQLSAINHSTVFNNLEPGSSYDFGVVGVNAKGPGAAAQQTVNIPAEGKPRNPYYQTFWDCAKRCHV